MGNKIANIKAKGIKKDKPVLKSENDLLEYYVDETILLPCNLEDFNRFIKGCEKLVRTCSSYTYYKSYLMGLGLNYCMVFPNIVDRGKESKAKVEMHHGPILNLFDICSIVATHLLRNGVRINTFIIAELVIEEHFNNNIQVVMLCETAHTLVHDNIVFINLKQAWGKLHVFLRRYHDGVDDDLQSIIEHYVKMSSKYHSNDKGVLDAQPIKNWSRR